MADAIETGPILPVRDLYQGEYWSVARSLEDLCEVRVASAGMGMCTMTTDAVAYQATFSPGSANSVTRLAVDAPNHCVKAAWWKSLARNGLGEVAWTEEVSQTVLVAVSSHYQEAMADDLIRIAASGRAVVILSGSNPLRRLNSVHGISHIRTDQWIRMALGGSTPCVGIRFVAHVIRTGIDHQEGAIREEMSRFEEAYRSGATGKLPEIDRQLVTDEEVRRWIRNKMRDGTSKPSKSAFLRLFRREGYACEQGRFGRLFEQTFDR